MGLKPGYKQTEVGGIPDDWQVVLLDSVTTRGTGHTPSKAHPEYWGGQIKWVSLQDSDKLDKPYIHDTAVRITPAGIANSSAKIHPKGTVVLSRDAGVGKSAIIADDMAVSQHFIAWKCGPLLINRFLYYWLQARKAEFERIAMGSTIKTIGLPYFRELRVPLPSATEQRCTAEALSDADALIESLEQLLTKKRHLKQGAMQELLTGKKRLPGYESTDRFKSTEAGYVPEDWIVRTINDVAVANWGDTSITKASYRDSGHLAFSASGPDGFLDGYQHEMQAVVISAIGAQCGKTWLATGKWTAIKNTIWFRANTGKADTGFLFYKTGDPSFWPNRGQAQPFIALGDVRRALVSLPPTASEQRAIASFLSDVDADISALEAKLSKARMLKQGMMQELLTGRVRLI